MLQLPARRRETKLSDDDDELITRALFTHFSLERFLCLDLWGQFLFDATATGAGALSLAS